jgi:hypothetical protein
VLFTWTFQKLSAVVVTNGTAKVVIVAVPANLVVVVPPTVSVVSHPTSSDVVSEEKLIVVGVLSWLGGRTSMHGGSH